MSSKKRKSTYRQGYAKSAKKLFKKSFKKGMNRKMNLSMIPERKTVDTDFTFSVASDQAQIQLVNGVAVGTDFTNRIGRKICGKILNIRFKAQNVASSAAVNNQQVLRAWVIYDTQPTGLSPAITDILTFPASVFDFNNLNNRRRFKTLCVKNFEIGPNAITATPIAIQNDQTVKYCEMSCPLKGLETIFEGSTSSIADISHNSIYVVFISRKPAATQTVTVRGSARYRFTDA